MSIRVLLIDDEALARKRLERLLQEHADVEVVGEAGDGVEALEEVLRRRPDLVFVDIRMPGRDGMALLRALREQLPEALRPLAVFTTAYEAHAVEAFELEGLDYLMKPLDKSGVGRALRRARKELWTRNPVLTTRETPVPGSVSDQASPETIAVYHGDRLLPVALRDIGCVFVERGLCLARTAEGPRRLKGSLQEVEARLPSPPFLRVSRSALVNLTWITHLEAGESGTFLAVLRSPLNERVPVSRRRSKHLRDVLGPIH